MERDKGEPEGLREWDPADPFAAGRAPRRRAPIDRAGPLPMRERSIDGGPPWPDLNHESGLFLHKHGKRGSFGRPRRDLPSGKAPEAAEQRPWFPANEEHPPLRFDEGERDGHRSGLFPIGGNRNLGHLPSMFRHDHPRRGMETLRAAVEPESLPYREDVVEARCREILDGGESHEESFVIGRAACDPGPLKEIFGDEDPVGVPRPAPGQITPFRGIPSEQSAPDLRRRGFAHRAHDTRRPTSEIREPWWRSPEANQP